MAHYILRICQGFEAAHHLYAYRGAPESVHGHSWRVELVLIADRLDDEGMGFDFVEAKSALGALTARFDHGDINATPPFDRVTPSTENLATWFHDQLAPRLAGARIREVTVWEGPDCSATYRPSRDEEE